MESYIFTNILVQNMIINTTIDEHSWENNDDKRPMTPTGFESAEA